MYCRSRYINDINIRYEISILLKNKKFCVIFVHLLFLMLESRNIIYLK